jgi:SAM-dependent methyltransferase
MSLPPRAPWQGARQILRYNRSRYFMALAAALAMAASALLAPVPAWLRGLLLAAALLTVAGAALSLLAAHWVYDRSPLHGWAWLAAEVAGPASWLVVHAGLDEASPALRHLYPRSRGAVLDIYDPATMTEPAIRIARAQAPPEPAIRARHDRLPVADGGADLALLFFAAHELRRPAERHALFRELARATAPSGRIVLVEHLRDLPNLLAFGPGALHFHARRSWLASFAEARLRIARERRITPLVRAFFLERA